MDSDKIKDFIVYNFEKAIVVLVMALSGFLVYSGLGQPIITEKHDPGRLAQRATEVKRMVDEDHTDAIVNDEENPREPKFDIAMEQAKFLKPIPASPYQLAAMDPSKEIKTKQRRQDPVIATPTAVQTTGVIASVAYRSGDGLYALTELEPADALEVIEAKPKRTRKKDRMQMAMMDGGYGDEMMEMEASMEMEMMAEMSGMGGMETGGTTGAGRRLKPQDNLGVTAGNTTSLANGAEQLPVPGIGLFIAGSAVIPHKEMIASYQKALSYSEGYSPVKRDLPLYVDYEVQRADVTGRSVDDLTDEDWILRDSRNMTIWNAANYWSGFAPEIVPADYTIPGVTMWIPPVVLDPYRHFATHPLIPMKTQRDLEKEREAKEQLERLANAGPAKKENFKIDIKGGNTTNFGASSAYGGMDEMDMMDMDMDMGYGDDMGMGMGGAVAGMEGKPAEEFPVDYKLIRFYDFFYVRGQTFEVNGKTVPQDPNAPKRNRSYVYRVRYAVNNPNFPQDENLQPQGSTLDADAYSAYVSLAADAIENNERDFRKWSEWSDPSAPTMLPELAKQAVGSVKPYKPRTISAGNRQIVLETSPPKAEIVSESFDPALGVFVPALIEATEGTVLSKKVESADVVDPITLEVKKTGEKIISSFATVIDVEGGAPLQIVEGDENIYEPGLFLMMDGEGKLVVRDEAEEQRMYRIKSFAEERGL